MEFVNNFKKTRIALGKKMKLFDYKNAKTLQTQFEKVYKESKKSKNE
jgi:hypothetical protein